MSQFKGSIILLLCASIQRFRLQQNPLVKIGYSEVKIAFLDILLKW